IGPAVMLIVILTAVRPWLNSNGQAQSPPAIVTASPQERCARPHPSVAGEPSVLPTPTTNTTAAHRDAGNARRITEASTPVRPTVIKARLSAELEDFACDPPDRPHPPASR